MKVLVPSPLYSYTGGRSVVEGSGSTLDQVLASLESVYPGLRFRIVNEQGRIRTHIRIFVAKQEATDLGCAVGPSDEVHIVAALSGG